ncbi:MAG: hypothetical protein WC756_01015 [Taibaiella sp.]|jgi:hypothetical protein
MKNLLFILFALTTITSFANDKEATPQFRTNNLTNQKWHIQSQSFASHDQSGTDVDTVIGNEQDYISFQENGYAYCLFNGVHDTLEYKIIGTDSISFGDTPFVITATSPDKLEFYQNEEEKNGDYNRVRYTLIGERNYAMKTVSKK